MKIVVYIYDGVTLMDAVGPYEVLRNIKGAEILFVAKEKGLINVDSGFTQVEAKYSISDIKEADVLLIPGSTITFIREMNNKSVLKWVKKIDKTTTYTTSVCSGSLILAATECLKGLKATSHWKTISLLKDFGIMPTRERVVHQDKYITSAGISAGIDMALYLTEKIAGKKQAKAVQLLIEYDPEPPFNSGNYKKADKEIIEMAEEKLTKDARKEIKLLDLIKSGRRLFKLK